MHCAGHHRVLGIAALLVAVVGALQGAERWELSQAIQCAWTNNPNARLAELRVEAAREVLRQAEAAAWPTLEFQSSYTRTDNPVQVFGAVLNQGELALNSLDLNDPPVADNLNVRGVAMLPLYTGGRLAAAKEAAQAQSRATRAEQMAVQDLLAFEVARVFYSILKSRELVRAAESTVDAFAKNLDLSEKRFQAGTILRAEVLDLEVQLAQAREVLVKVRNALALYERSFRNLLGLESGEVTAAEPAPEAVLPENWDASGRAELRAARQRIQAAQAQVEAARSGYRPAVDAFASYDYDHGWEFNGSGKSWTAGAMLRWKLWDGQLTRSRVAEARAGLQSAEEQERKLRLEIDLDVERARLQLKEADERLAVTERAVAQAGESVELTRSRFEQGLVLATQLIDAETALTGARVRRAEAEADRRIAVAALRRALGVPQVKELQP